MLFTFVAAFQVPSVTKLLTQPGAANSYLIESYYSHLFSLVLFMSSFRRRSARYVPRIKRNAERHIRSGSITMADSNLTYTGYVYTAGTAQTIKSIKLDIGGWQTTGYNSNGAAYAIVVCREGYQANSLQWPALTTDMYNPTMDVLISGVLTDGTVEDHKWNKIGRRLKTGDRLCLIIYNTTASTAIVCAFELSFSFMT